VQGGEIQKRRDLGQCVGPSRSRKAKGAPIRVAGGTSEVEKLTMGLNEKRLKPKQAMQKPVLEEREELLKGPARR